MPKKKGLGREINKSVEVMDNLLSALKKFTDMPLKKGLVSNGLSDNQLGKVINESSIDAFSLINKVEDLKHLIKSLKPKDNSRFASIVVNRFLESC